MNIQEQYVKETGDTNQYLTYENDYKEFVISEKFYEWIEAKFTSYNSECAVPHPTDATPKLCPNCEKAYMQKYATNEYCPACGQIRA
jgi:hypothetical protein